MAEQICGPSEVDASAAVMSSSHPCDALRNSRYSPVAVADGPAPSEQAGGTEDTSEAPPRWGAHYGRWLLAFALLASFAVIIAHGSGDFKANANPADTKALTQDFTVDIKLHGEGRRRKRYRYGRLRRSPNWQPPSTTSKPIWKRRPGVTPKPHSRSPWTHHSTILSETYSQLLHRAPAMIQASLQIALESGVLIELDQHHFKHGTYIITQPGVYKLRESIIFAPNKENAYMPFRDRPPYTFDKGYWLGFFAAIVVMSPNVLIDLNGHMISMSEEFSLRQRYFSAIELSSKPFQAKTGPGVFGYVHDQLIPSSGVVIYNGVLGVSSRTGIHGTSNNGVWVESVGIRDFEVGGIQLNGATNVHISNLQIGPSLGAPGSAHAVPASATFSFAQCMLNIITNTGLKWVPEFSQLRSAVDDYLHDVKARGHPTSDTIFNDRAEGFKGLPDGGAIYGILLHSTGVDLHDFSFLAASHERDPPATPNTQSQVSLSNVIIKDLHIKTDEIVRMSWKGRPLTGIMGESFQGVRSVRSNGMFQDNRVVDAQMALQKLKNEDSEANWVNYGSPFVPKEVLRWADGEGTLEDLERAGLTYDCERDAMGHTNKGAVGLRLEGVGSVNLQAVTITALKNLGSRGPDHLKCRQEPGGDFRGADVRGISLSDVASLEGSEVYISDLQSTTGLAMGVEARRADQNIHFTDLAISGLHGADGELRNEMAYVARHEEGGLDIHQV